jgi:nicotinamidase-related amidase
VKDVPVAELRNNTMALANIAKLGGAPIIYTASEPNGPNGPLMEELNELKGYATYVPRKGEISAWDNAEFVKAVEATGRKTLILAGTLTSVCMAFPSISAVAAGYKVYAVVDASGNWSKMATDLTIARIVQAGVMPIDTVAVISELQITWNRAEATEFANIYADYAMPHYRLLIESYDKAQAVQKEKK